MKTCGGRVLIGADAVVPVPLHPSRRRQRGFNQAADLARGLGLPVIHALRRVRATRPQADLSADDRLTNVDAAFAAAQFPEPPQRWRDATLVLVDDVATTGATLDACAGVLLGAGAKEVRALTAARAVKSRL
jgi:ComF family protein